MSNFANPQPPANYHHRKSSNDDSVPLTNDDFRKLLMTPSAAKAAKEGLGSHSSSASAPKSEHGSSSSSHNKKKMHNEAYERRREKKLFYASLVKEEKDKEAELAQKYRDRAKERRELEKDGKDLAPDFVSTTSNFRAVAPEFSLIDSADRRRQIIEESKFLGGDLEHTHLVKGLDYALLQKVKAELEHEGAYDYEEKKAKKSSAGAEDEDEQEEDVDEEEEGASDEEYEEDKIKKSLKPKLPTKTSTAALATALSKSLKTGESFSKQLATANSVAAKITAAQQKQAQRRQDDEDEDDEAAAKGVQFKTKLGRNIYRVLFEQPQQAHKVNDLFLPHRMTYIVDVNDEETDVPVTSIRSKAECPTSDISSTLSTNDIVINKLTQILSYLRHGKRDAKKKKKSGLEVTATSSIADEKRDSGAKDLDIYDDLDDYAPEISSRKSKKEDSITASRQSYFSGSSTSNGSSSKYHRREEEEDERQQAPTQEAALEFIKNVNEKYKNVEMKKPVSASADKKQSGMMVKFDPDSYSECYPGTQAEEDVNIDSDEEADFSKMDLGNKKGPVNRWDFDTNEEYSSYMSNKEALPKAAFQFGVKMNDGRKTKRLPGDAKTEKAKLDREWTQISKIIDKRKSEGGGGDYKKPKY